MSEQTPEPRNFNYQDIYLGMKERYHYMISPSVYEGFLAVFQDYSPIHVDQAYARDRGFEGKVMHGSMLNGFLSHFVGMYFPGRRSLLLTVDLRFAQPCYLGDKIWLEAEVTQKVDARQVLVLDVNFHNETRSWTAARARAQVVVREEK